jgi:hypothetical protein
MESLATLVVSALASRGAQALTSAGAGAVGRLVALVRRRLADGTSGAVELRDALQHPEDSARRDRLVLVLADAIRADPVFAQELRSVYGAVSTDANARPGAVVNHVSGKAGSVIQARDIHGDISM